MTTPCWRIGTDAPDYEADDLTGKGAELTGGRWNPKGIPIVYTSMTRSLACLETFVHFNAGGLPLNRYLVEISFPDSLWRAAETRDVSSLPTGWDAEPPGRVSIQLGTEWLKSKRSVLLLAPSIIVPEEINVLINPQHPDAGIVQAQKIRKWSYDPRLMKLQ